MVSHQMKHINKQVEITKMNETYIMDFTNKITGVNSLAGLKNRFGRA